MNDIQKKLQEIRAKQGATTAPATSVRAKLDEIRARKSAGTTTLEQKLAEMRANRKPTYGETFVSDVAEEGGKTVEALKGRGEQFKEIAKQQFKGEINPLQTGIRTVGTTAGAVFDVLGGAVSGLAKGLTPEPAEKAIAETGKRLIETPAGQMALKQLARGVVTYEEWKARNPELAKDFEAVANIATVLPVEKIVGASAKGLVGLGRKTKQAAIAGTEATARTAKNLPGAALAEKVATSVKETATRPFTNLKAAQEAAKELVTSPEPVKRAAFQGIPLRTATKIAKATPDERKIMRDMVSQAESFIKGGTDILPQDVAGREMLRQFKGADDLRKKIGQEVGEQAKKLKGVQLPVRQKALMEMRKINGLEDLRIDNKGRLDFSDTVLSSDLAKADRAVIEKVFSEIAEKDAFGVNQQRQFIFEYLGGKKLAPSTPVLETADKALEAMRKGMADAIEAVSPGYKAANQRYAKVADPYQQIRRFFKTVEGADADLLEAHAGTLMRRLTSESPSRTQIEQAARQLNQALVEAGMNPGADLSSLAEFSAVLADAFPELVRATSFTGATGTGVKKGLMGLVDAASEKVIESFGVSSATKQKALRDLFDSLNE